MNDSHSTKLLSETMDNDLIGHNLSVSKLDRLKQSMAKTSSRSEAEKESLKEACQGFETIFLNTMLKTMRSTLPGSDLFGGGYGMGMYKSMYDQYLSEEIAANGNGPGIGALVYKQLVDSVE